MKGRNRGNSEGICLKENGNDDNNIIRLNEGCQVIFSSQIHSQKHP